MRPTQCPCYEDDQKETPCPRDRQRDGTTDHNKPYCDYHMAKKYVVKKSTVAGLGLFYNGEEVLKPYVKNRNNQGPLMTYEGPTVEGYVDGNTEGYEENEFLIYNKKQNFTINQIDPSNSSIARWINDAHGQGKNIHNNTFMRNDRGVMNVRVRRNINKGDELLIAYSNQRVPTAQKYWARPEAKEEKEEKEEKTEEKKIEREVIDLLSDSDDDYDVTHMMRNPATRPTTGGKQPRFVPRPNSGGAGGGKDDMVQELSDSSDEMDGKHVDDEDEIPYDEEDPDILQALANSRQTAIVEEEQRSGRKRKRIPTNFHRPGPDAIRRRTLDTGGETVPWQKRGLTAALKNRMSPEEKAAKARAAQLKKKKHEQYKR